MVQPFKPFSLNIRGSLIEFSRPQVMAIINATPDSFYAGSRVATTHDIALRTEKLLREGADMLDIGACSTRPGAPGVPPDEECRRIIRAIRTVRRVSPRTILSVDTFRAETARIAVAEGADIINDVSGGTLDSAMFSTVAELSVPYILMHMRGTPATMQQFTDYSPHTDVAAAVIADLAEKITNLRSLGVADLIVDPGFGFSKTLSQNYRLLAALPVMERMLGCPLLVGVSRKSMITAPLAISPGEALTPTTVINAFALERGASILRVHDPLEAAQAIRLTHMLIKESSI